MTTRYQCKGCQEIFEGFDPTPFGQPAINIYPLCPRAELLMQALFTSADSLDAKGTESNRIESEHEVGLAVTAIVAESKPKVTANVWGKPPIIKQDTPEEVEAAKVRAQLEALRRAREKAEAEADSLARKLVQRMEAGIAKREGTVSSNFTSDLEYGTKANGSQYTASADIISRASTMWLLKGTDYSYRAPKFKVKWNQHQANFEKLIVAGNASEGKHNFHVVRH